MMITRRRGDAKNEEEIAEAIVNAAFVIHSSLGPGLLEGVYEVLLADVLTERGFAVERHVDVPVHFRGKVFPVGFRADLIVERKVCAELKSVETLAPVHAKQLLTYLKLLDFRLGLLINFGAPLLKQGIRRIVNGLDSSKHPPSLRALAPSREKLS